MRKAALSAICLLFLAACDRSFVSGIVYDVRGEALPGVAVTVEGTSYQTQTDALGEYRIPYNVGNIVLNFVKTGYTPGTLLIQSDTPRAIEANPMSLWALPIEKGVYLFEDYRYVELTKVHPETYATVDRRTVFGTPRWAEVETDNSAPLIMCYRMPAHDVRFCKMDLVEESVVRSGGGEELVQIWSSVRTVPAGLQAIDEPDGLLQQVRLAEPLEPGTYAVHWGALDGRSTLDGRAFLFDVVDSSVVLPSKEEAESAEGVDKQPAEQPEETEKQAEPQVEPPNDEGEY